MARDKFDEVRQMREPRVHRYTQDARQDVLSVYVDIARSRYAKVPYTGR